MPTMAATNRTSVVVLPADRTIRAGMIGTSGGSEPEARPTEGQLWPR